MAKNTGKVREKSGNFVSPEKWEPCQWVPTRLENLGKWEGIFQPGKSQGFLNRLE